MKKNFLVIFTLLTLSSTLLFGKTLVTVNGHAITDSLLANGYESLDETQKNNLMTQLIREELIYAELLKTSLINGDKFQQAFTQQKNLIEKQYEKNLNSEQLRSIKGSIAVALYQQKEFKKAMVSASETKHFYNNNPKTFKYPNSIEIANIIVQDKSEANNILKSLQKSKNLDEDFIKKANEYKQNGYMGWFGKGSMPENLFAKAYKYKVKRLLNAPVKTKHGYNVVYLLNKKSAGKLTLAESTKRIEQVIKQKKIMDKLRDKVENLYAKAEIVY